MIALVTLAFGWVLWPLFGAVFWAVALVIVFDPIASRVSQHLGQRRNLAALIMITGFLLLINADQCGASMPVSCWNSSLVLTTQ
ncbi:hypothetical protein [Antarcticimicrobium luteum]|uniref:AI-2E family transporter n=1 Tax=Antarcticimicrobium luteum TaxID=2547397 RepID=A0A4R5V088_9RHOB|nr:hypothetical protein [Antarcticimicrobium luteum]TDK45133.1 hypothetical protein E1832_14820 [Antarcticimicrobium luteum]